jgi:Spy/CpxP family protein refolding chaperone
MKRMTLTALAVTAALVLGGGMFLGDHLSAQGPGGGGRGGPGRGGPGDMGGGGRGPGGPGGMGAINPMLLRQLELTEAQRERVREITDSHRDEQKALGDRARTAHLALEAAIVAGPLDESTIRGKAADIAAVDADIAVASGRVYSEIFQTLTPDQQTKLKTLQAEQAERMGKGRPQRQ